MFLAMTKVVQSRRFAQLARLRLATQASGLTLIR